MKLFKNISVLSLLLLCQNLFSQNIPACENPILSQTVATYPIDKNQVLDPQILFTPPPSPPPADYRLIFWVHGLGAQYQNAWTKARSATENGAGVSFPKRKVFGYRPQYPETGIEAGATELRNDMVPIAYSPGNGGIDPLKNFIIAHSQGGIVAREVDRQYFENPDNPRSIGGIVTFGTPHQGARILNNKYLVQELMSDACSSLLTGPVLEALSNSAILDLFINDGVVKDKVDEFCDAAGDIIPNFIKSFKNGTTDDYYVGAPKITELNAQETWNIEHKLGIYGVEYANGENSHNPKALFWRTMSSFKVQDPEPQPYFEANGDNVLVDGAAAQLATFFAKRNAAQTTIDNLEWWGFPCDNLAEWYFYGVILCKIKNRQHADATTRRNAFQKGINWFMNLDEGYKTLIGAVNYETTQTCECRYIMSGQANQTTSYYYPPGILNQAACNAYVNTYPPNWPCTWKDVTQLVRKESDGVVLRESAENFPGSAGYFRMEQTNHFQMRNNSETKRALLWIYNSSLSSGSLGSPDPFFTTDKQ